MLLDHTLLWLGFNPSSINHELFQYTDDVTLWPGFNPSSTRGAEQQGGAANFRSKPRAAHLCTEVGARNSQGLGLGLKGCAPLH
jgi:hypothetical protein